MAPTATVKTRLKRGTKFEMKLGTKHKESSNLDFGTG